MKHLKGLQRTLVLSALAVFAFGATPAKAGPFLGASPYTSDTVAGTCSGVAGTTDCGTATGHIGVSVVGTLSINEEQAVNFGNVAVKHGLGAADGHVILGTNGAIGAVTGLNTDGLLLLSGANANGGTGGGEPGQVGNDGQHPGVYAITGANEGGDERVYISFADTANNPLDCQGDNNYPLNKVIVYGPAGNTFTVKDFTFDPVVTAGASGTDVGAVKGGDVYGHYINTSGATSNTAFYVDVGATLSTSTTAHAYLPGKYVGEFNITASY